MRIRRRGRLDPDRADQLLDRASGGAPGADDRLTRLLAAAARPTPTGAVAGEDVALRAFRSARTAAPVAPPRRRRAGRRVAGAGAWVAVAATTATAGVAFAASTHPWSGGRPATPPATPAVVPPGVPTSSGASVGTSAGAAGRPGTGSDASASAPRHHLIGLCRAYLPKTGAERGKSLDTTSSAPLIEAAGGRDRVDAYCTRLLAEPDVTPEPVSTSHAQTVPPGRDPSHDPSHKPSVKPSGKQKTP